VSDATAQAAVLVGHWTDEERRTGCTVILFDRLVPTVVDIRGGAPGSRETDLLAADRTVGAVDAILFTGGSAHGLGAAEGVMQYLREHERGVPTSAGLVPIVSAAVLYDLGVGEAVWPTAENAYAACVTAVSTEDVGVGRVGAGTGATLRKVWPSLPSRPGGFAVSKRDVPGLGHICVLVVLNAIGDTFDHREALMADPAELGERSATSLIAVIVDGQADSRTLRRCAIAAHDGLARVIMPAHTQWDGDLVYASTTLPEAPIAAADSFRWAITTELAVESALRLASQG
jgi:L-aminopeptidase/D-esterase-like protein